MEPASTNPSAGFDVADLEVAGHRGAVKSNGELRHPIPPAALANLTQKLGHDFADRNLLGQSLTHRSWCAEHAGFQSNERLEFLGDAVLGMVVTAAIFSRHSDAGEGQLSRIRASVVCAPALAEMAMDLDLGSALLLGKGEDQSGGRQRPSILADAMEAVIGAVFIDGGMVAAEAVVSELVASRLDDAGIPDDKSRLHQRVAQEHDGQIRYEITGEGPEHSKTFRAVVYLDEEPFGTGSGGSKKQAEQAAAREAWRKLGPSRGDTPAREDSDA